MYSTGPGDLNHEGREGHEGEIRDKNGFITKKGDQGADSTTLITGFMERHCYLVERRRSSPTGQVKKYH